MSLLLALLACTGSGPEDTDPSDPPVLAGLVGDHPLNPFPVGALHTEGGTLALDAAAFDLPAGLTALPVERLAWRTGFSPAQTSVLTLPAIDASTLPGWRSPTPGQGGVRLADLTEGTWLPVMAELDAHEESEVPTLLIRPMVAVPYGHEVAVVVTTAVAPRPAHFQDLLDGDDALGPVLTGLLDDLAALGTPEADIALAWSYPVGDGTTPLRSAWSQIPIPTTWSFDSVRDVADGGVAPLTWRAAQGTVEVPDFLVDDKRLQLAADGSVSPTGTASASIYVHIPPSVADAPAGSVPVLLFGHGIFGEPALYLDEADDPSKLLQLAEDAGFIVIGSEWRGLSYPDRLGAVEVAQDFGRMHEITDRLVQGQANVAGLIRLIKEGDLLEDPVFTGASGQLLADADHLRYYGISLGGIEGAVMLANDPPLDAAVLHVGGSTWSTMLERSSNWPAFELFLSTAVEDPLVRQRLYAVSQLWWDVADPISYTAELSQRDFLLQESLGDEQVPNMTTRTLARSVGLYRVVPGVEPVWGVSDVPGSTVASRGLVQFDPEKELPPDENRPAPITLAHDTPRQWATTNAQTRAYLAVDAPRTITLPCGPTEPCTASNSEP